MKATAIQNFRVTVICLVASVICTSCVAVCRVNEQSWRGGYIYERWENGRKVEKVDWHQIGVTVYPEWKSDDRQVVLFPLLAWFKRTPPYAAGIYALADDDRWATLELTELRLEQDGRVLNAVKSGNPVVSSFERFENLPDDKRRSAKCVVDLGDWPINEPGKIMKLTASYKISNNEKSLYGKYSFMLNYEYERTIELFVSIHD